MNTPPRGIGATTLERLREITRSQGISLWAAAKNAQAVLGRSAGSVVKFLDLIDALQTETQGQPLSKATEIVIARSGLREHYRKERGEQAEARLENLDELVSAARSFERSETPEPDEAEPAVDPLTLFLTHAALESGGEQAGPGEDCVQLMTLHAAKGLEFPVVFMVGMENGLFPSLRTMEEGNLEEERRLCYVGITRARRQLYLSYAESRRVHGVEQRNLPSLFLRDIPPECIVETRPRLSITRPAFSSREPLRSYGGGGAQYLKPAALAQSSPGYGGFKLGSRVLHAKFGEGVILSFEGEGERAQAEIRFKAAGVKRLMLSMAKLEAL